MTTAVDVAAVWVTAVAGIGAGPEDAAVTTWVGDTYALLTVVTPSRDLHTPLQSPIVQVDVYACTLTVASDPASRAGAAADLLWRAAYGYVTPPGTYPTGVLLRDVAAEGSPRRLDAGQIGFGRAVLELRFTYLTEE